MIVTERVAAGSSPRLFRGDLFTVAAEATDLRGGLVAVVDLLLQERAVAGVEWWTPAEDGTSFRRELGRGSTVGPRTPCPLGAAGVLVLIGPRVTGLEAAATRLRPLVHHWWIAERLADHAARLARRNSALEDTVALVAHDVKSSLMAALRSGRLHDGLRRTLGIVDSIADAVHAGEVAEHVASTVEAVRDAVADVDNAGLEVRTSGAGQLPFPPDVLRAVLRNLVGNAAAAGALSIHVSTDTHAGRSTLTVDDDGCGFGAVTAYRTGSRAGLALCERLLARFGGRLDVAPHPVRGTRAVLVASGTAA
jgi:signal transduction histidine kinase